MNLQIQFLLEKAIHSLSVSSFETAKLFLNQAVKIDPKNHEVYRLLGVSSYFLGDQESAVNFFNKALEINPKSSSAYNNKGNLLYLQGYYEEATIYFKKSIECDKENHEAFNNLGNAHLKIEKNNEAIICYEKAIKLKPDYAEAYIKIAHLMYACGGFGDAKNFFTKAISVDQNNVEAHLNLGSMLLEKFDFKSGWMAYRWRSKTKEHIRYAYKTSRPEWRGDNSCSRLLIVGEQGIGDQILYGSMLNEFKNSNHRITVALDNKLVSIFRHSFPKFRFVDIDSYLSEDEYDEFIDMGNLGIFFRNKLEDFYNFQPFLYANQHKKLQIRGHFRANKVYCGISWKSTNTKIGDRKSIDLSALFPVLKIPEIDFINLQYGEVLSEINQLLPSIQNKLDLVEQIDKFDDIDGLAALIDKCTYVVTTSNTTAHLSGALGKETLLLLPFSVGKFWYWHNQDCQSIWYPSVRVFQQQQDGDWSQPIKKIQTFLEEKIAI